MADHNGMMSGNPRNPSARTETVAGLHETLSRMACRDHPDTCGSSFELTSLSDVVDLSQMLHPSGRGEGPNVAPGYTRPSNRSGTPRVDSPTGQQPRDPGAGTVDITGDDPLSWTRPGTRYARTEQARAEGVIEPGSRLASFRPQSVTWESSSRLANGDSSRMPVDLTPDPQRKQLP
jgi:hypothetical protein